MIASTAPFQAACLPALLTEACLGALSKVVPRWHMRATFSASLSAPVRAAFVSTCARSAEALGSLFERGQLPLVLGDLHNG